MINVNSGDWLAIVEWANGQIAAAHIQLERPDISFTETDNLRGRIAALRELLALPAKQSEITEQPANLPAVEY